MKRIKLFNLAMLSLAVLTFGSCKKEGCTDATAKNYNESAKKDDGSCISYREEMVGAYKVNVNVTCGGGYSEVLNNETLTITESSSANNKIVITGEGFILTATVNQTAITIDNQSDNEYSYSGSGQISGSNINLNISEYDSEISESCNYIISGTKQ